MKRQRRLGRSHGGTLRRAAEHEQEQEQEEPVQSPGWILMNLCLSAAPLALAYLWTYCIRRFARKRSGVHWVAFTPLIALWVAFLPNTCYLLTEWRHFLFDAHFVDVRSGGEHDRVVMLRVARQGLFFLCYSLFGVFCLVYSIRPVEQFMAKLKVQKAVWMAPLFLLTSVGVYLGLIVRLNSWDILTRPLAVGQTLLYVAGSGHLIQTVLIFAVLLWICYEIGNIWADGVALRIKRRKLV